MQVDGTNARRFGGTGLGLAISLRLVRLMGGRMWVDSQPGRGSAFHFTVNLEVGSPGNQQPLTPLCPPEILRGCRVLVVDDNASSRSILDRIVRSCGLRPVLAESAGAALKMLAEHDDDDFALLLVDANMPGMDGFALTRRIEKQGAARCPCILMLNSADIRTVGAEFRRTRQCVVKPVTPSNLVRAIRNSFETVPPEPPLRPRPRAATTQRACILLAEDNPVNQKVAVSILEKLGHSVAAAATGAEAVGLAQREAFDLILMDVQMPGMDGYEATRAIRAEERRRGGHIPIVALTAHAMKGDREICLAAGMDDYIGKPIRRSELEAVLQRWAPDTGVESQSPAEPFRSGRRARSDRQ